MSTIPVRLRMAMSIIVIATFGSTALWVILTNGHPLLERASWGAAALSPVLVVVGAVLVLAQLQESFNATRAQLFDATAGRIHDMDKIFIDHPEMRPYIYEQKPLPRPYDASNPETQRALAVAEMLIDFFDTEMLRAKTFPSAVAELPNFENWIRETIRTSEPVCRLLHQELERGEDGWYITIQRYFKEAMSEGHACWAPVPVP